VVIGTVHIEADPVAKHVPQQNLIRAPLRA
jgi:hypothetical protein